MNYEILSQNARDLLRQLVGLFREGELGEEFMVGFSGQGGYIGNVVDPDERLSTATFRALERVDLLIRGASSLSGSTYSLTPKAFQAVDSDFDEVDDSFLRHLRPLADVAHFHQEVQKRVLPMLATGSTPSAWDAALRQAGVLLEERVRVAAGFEGREPYGDQLFGEAFHENGPLAAAFESHSQRTGYRNLCQGLNAVFRGEVAHRFVDPTPEEAGAALVFYDLLIRKLDGLTEAQGGTGGTSSRRQ